MDWKLLVFWEIGYSDFLERTSCFLIWSFVGVQLLNQEMPGSSSASGERSGHL
jgi:hypothetical protein